MKLLLIVFTFFIFTNYSHAKKYYKEINTKNNKFLQQKVLKNKNLKKDRNISKIKSQKIQKKEIKSRDIASQKLSDDIEVLENNGSINNISELPLWELEDKDIN